MKSMRIRVFLSSGMLLLLCCGSMAQESKKAGSIVIVVKDQTGAVVPKAQIQIRPVLIDLIGKSLETGSDGTLSLEVAPGSYEVIVDSPGFVTMNKGIEVKPATHETIDIVLKVGSCPPGACTVTTNVRPVSFPAFSQAVSPDGHYAVVGVGSDTEPYQTVFLEDRLRKSRRKLFTYGRHIAVLWKSDSRFFAVTDYVGSDSSACSIIPVNEKAPPLQVLKVLSHQLTEDTWKRLQGLLSNHHAYVEAIHWEEPGTLEVRVSGYGEANPAGFAEFYGVLLPTGH